MTLAWPPTYPEGAKLLNDVESFYARFIAYPSEAALVAHTLWTAHAHLMACWESTPRIAFLSPEPGSGKSRALEVTDLLVPRPVHAVNCSPAYLFRKVSDEAGPPTLLYDEIDTVFGPKAKENEDIRGMLNAGHRRGATAGRCVIHGKIVDTEELPAYCAVALAGLNDLPDTVSSRSILIRMKRRAPTEEIEPFRRRVHAAVGHELRDGLAEWAQMVEGEVTGAWPVMPKGIEDRDADIWEALLAIADAAGEDWPERARVTAVTFVTDKSAARGSLGVQLLSDIHDAFDKSVDDRMTTAALLGYLTGLDDAPWGNLRGRELDSRGMARYLRRYDISPHTIRVEEGTAKGYHKADFGDAWSRYLVTNNHQTSLEGKINISEGVETALPLASDSTVTSVTTSQQTFDVTDETPAVTHEDPFVTDNDREDECPF